MEYVYSDDLCKAISDNYVVEGVAVKKGKILFTVNHNKNVKNDMDADWVKEHKAKSRVDPYLLE